MTGRARGRARGRGRSQAPPPGQPGPTESSQTESMSQQPTVGRGRSRGAPVAQPQAPVVQPQAAVAQPPGAVAQPKTGSRPSERPPGPVRREPTGPQGERRFESRYAEVQLRPAHVESKAGTTGAPIQLVANYFILHTRPDSAIYQYHVDFNPPVDSKALRKKLLRDHEELVGKVRAFDGMVLFLPRRLPNPETELVSKLKEGDEIHIKIKLTNELQPDNPTCLQLINILFRRWEGRTQAHPPTYTTHLHHPHTTHKHTHRLHTQAHTHIYTTPTHHMHTHTPHAHTHHTHHTHKP